MDPSIFKQGSLQELKQRLLFLLGAIVVYRVGATIPVPGLDPVRLALLFNEHHTSSGILSLFNMFSGGALKRLTVFALGLMPYISASIIVQLLSSVVPYWSELKKEGESGQRKLNQYTRFATLGLALFQSIGMCRFLVGSGIALENTLSFYLVASITLITGTLFLMWLGEQITERGIGNGISMIIFAGIVAGLPSALGKTLETMRQGQIQPFVVLLIMLIIVAVIACVVFVERAQRHIVINHAQRHQAGRYNAQASHLPLKINMAGVIPPIFASSIILFPATLAQWFGKTKGFAWLTDIGLALSQGQPLHIVMFTLAIIFFCFFYTALVFNPKETADHLKRSGAFLPGIRPGQQTAEYIDAVMTRLTLIGAVYITLVCLLPEFMYLAWHVPFYFGGTSLLIIVVVVIDFMSQLQALLMSHQYDSLMRNNLKSNGRRLRR